MLILYSAQGVFVGAALAATHAIFKGIAMKVVQSNSHFSQYFKPILTRLRYWRSNNNKLMIMGCQRSGTTLVSKFFDDLFDCSVYGEFSVLSNTSADRLSLKPIPVVKRILSKNTAPFIISKPLVESGRASELLREFPDSKILWMFRDPVDVAMSMIRKFGQDNGGTRQLDDILKGDISNWRARYISGETRAWIKKYYDKFTTPYEAALIFWHVRNQLFFEQELDRSPRVMVMSYEELLNAPLNSFNPVLEFMGHKTVTEVRKVANQSQPLRLDCNPELMSECREMYNRLNACN